METSTSTFEDVGTGDLRDKLQLDATLIMELEGDILHDCIQTIVELGGASRAVGRGLGRIVALYCHSSILYQIS